MAETAPEIVNQYLHPEDDSLLEAQINYRLWEIFGKQ